MVGPVPGPTIGLYAAENGAPVLLHLPTGAVIIPAAGHVVLIHPDGTSPTALADAAVDQFVPLGGDDLVLAAAVGRNTSTPTPYHLSRAGLRLDLAPGVTLRVSDAAIARARPVVCLAVDALRDLSETPHALRLEVGTANRLVDAITEVRSRRHRRDADEVTDGLARERVRMTIDTNPATGFVAVVGGGATHGYAEHEVLGHTLGAGDSPATPTLATDVDPDALAAALGLVRAMNSGQTIAVTVPEDRGPVVVRARSVVAIVPPSRVGAGRPNLAPTESRAQSALLARLQ